MSDAHQPSPSPNSATLREIVKLGKIVYSDEGFEAFLTTPLAIFGGRTAHEMIASGQADVVLAALATDYEGLGSA